MKRTIRLNERDLSRIVKKIIEQEEYNIEKTVIDTKAFTNEDIPEECKGIENPEMSKVEMITACITKITEKSSSLSSALTALTDLMNKAKSDSSSMTESRRRYKNY
jgi:hypothetical protein